MSSKEKELKELECFEQYFDPNRQPLVDEYFCKVTRRETILRKIKNAILDFICNPFVLMMAAFVGCIIYG